MGGSKRMAVGQNLKKWTWMMDHVEVRGVVRFGDLADGTELEASDSFNLELDPNYRHLVSSMRGNNGLFTNPNEIHVEAYSQSPNRFDDPDNINRAEPFYLPDKPASQKFEVRIDKAGNKRPLRAGDHVRLFGRWIIENQHEDICWTRKWGLGTDDALKLKVGCVWAELHPFDWQNIELVDALPDKSVATLSLAAPVYEEKYQRGAVVDALQVWMVDHVFIL